MGGFLEGAGSPRAGPEGRGGKLGRRQEAPQAQSLPGPQKSKVQNCLSRPSREKGTGQGRSRPGGQDPLSRDQGLGLLSPGLGR